jgi:hypothetical protein
MQHYRVNKVARPGGEIVKRKDILASDDRQAVQAAEHDPDCPICEVHRAGKVVGTID